MYRSTVWHLNTWTRTCNEPTLSFCLSVCSFRFSQKRAKKIEGDSIYIRHSLLMLEVCIPAGGTMVPVCVFLLFGAAASLLMPRLHVSRFTLHKQRWWQQRLACVCVFVRLWSCCFRVVLLSLTQDVRCDWILTFLCRTHKKYCQNLHKG